jgi:hypothetical protein
MTTNYIPSLTKFVLDPMVLNVGMYVGGLGDNPRYLGRF